MKEKLARVDYGDQGIREDVNISLVDVRIGSYVLVQGGFAIKVLTTEEAQEILEALKCITNEFRSM